MNVITYIGSNSLNTIFYTGFIYEINVYINSPSISTFITTNNCNGCSFCPVSGSCIPSCTVNQYYSTNTQECTNCPSTCTNGCRNSQNCSLCIDDYCVSCTSVNFGSCSQCIPYFEVQNFKCVPCNSSSYYDFNTFSCLLCTGLCTSCISETICFECVKNSYLNNQNQCVCNLGYSGTTSCTRNYFNVSLSIDQNNNVFLTFTEGLNTSLSYSTISLYVQSNDLTFTITEIDSKNYKLNISFTNDVAQNSKLQIYFSQNLTSANNSLLLQKTLSITLFATSNINSDKAIQAQIQSVKAMASQGTTVGLSVVLTSSVLNLNPGSFFNYMNTAEIFYSLCLFNIDLHPVVSAFLLQLRLQGGLPNFLSYAAPQSKGVVLPSNLTNYGYPSSLMIQNFGGYLQGLFFSFFLAICLFFLNKNTWCQKKLKKITENFKFGVFLRF